MPCNQQPGYGAGHLLHEFSQCPTIPGPVEGQVCHCGAKRLHMVTETGSLGLRGNVYRASNPQWLIDQERWAECDYPLSEEEGAITREEARSRRERRERIIDFISVDGSYSNTITEEI